MSVVETQLRVRYGALVARAQDRWPADTFPAPGDTIEALAQACRDLSARLNGREPLRVQLGEPLVIPERSRPKGAA